MKNFAKLFAEILIIRGLIDSKAISDPEGYDSYRTKQAVIDAANDVLALFEEEEE